MNAAALVASGHWRFIAGMATTSKFRRVIAIGTGESADDVCVAEEGASEDDCFAVWCSIAVLLPDLDDPATLALLPTIAREAWGESAHAVRLETNVLSADGTGTQPALWWAIAIGCASVPFVLRREDGSSHHLAGPTESAAWQAAILAAPPKGDK